MNTVMENQHKTETIKQNTLVINKQYNPLAVETVKKSVTKLTKGTASFIEAHNDITREQIELRDKTVLEAMDDQSRENYLSTFILKEELDKILYEEKKTCGINHVRIPYTTYTVEEWLSLPVRPTDRTLQLGSGERKRNIRVPDVVLLTDYSELPRMEVRLSKRNMLIRDNHCCQYCGVKVHKGNMSSSRRDKDITWDHVVPKAKGGKSTWENLVICCHKCNAKKADKTLQEAKMILLKNPIKPNLHPLYCRSVRNRPKCWDLFLDKTAKWADGGTDYSNYA